MEREGGGINLFAGLSHTEVYKCIRMAKETQQLKISFTQNSNCNSLKIDISNLYIILFLLNSEQCTLLLWGILNMTAS
jgi:hypothetical protein